MRIIAGKWRSRQLARPQTPNTRPMPDRIREAVFSFLGTYFDAPGTLPPIFVADVFAGSGSMGLEALSRGAAMCRFFERERLALASLRQNIEALSAGQSATIVAKDAWKSAIMDGDERPFDLVLLDPPYQDSTDTTPRGHVRTYLERLFSMDGSNPVVVLHHQDRVQYDLGTGEPYRLADRRRYGSGAISVFVR